MKKNSYSYWWKGKLKNHGGCKRLGLKVWLRLVLLHVKRRFEIDSHLPSDFNEIENPEVKKALEDYAVGVVDKAAEYFKDTSIKVSKEVIKGHIASQICDYAEENKCDLIMISSHGHGAAERFLIGGVTSRVVHHANVPVMVIR